MKNSWVFKVCTMATAIAFTFMTNAAFACTGITLRAQDGSVVYGRTLEWGAFDINSEVMIIPRGHEFTGKLDGGQKGMTWTAKYGGVAFNGFEQDMWIEGMNEKGLVVSALYHPDFAEYPKLDPKQQSISMAATDVMAYIATSFATIDEVRAGLNKIRAVSVVDPVLGFPAPLHILVTEASGKAIAIEFVNKEVQIFDAPLGVMTNAPNYDWHMTNLRNYLNLSPVALPTKKVEDLDFATLGAGSGMIGLPGDHTPVSRFVRAVAFSKTARPTDTGKETMYEVFRILDSFNVPLGAAEGSDIGEGSKGMRSATLWTTAVDAKNLKVYYHTMHNRRVRMIDMKTIDFSGFKGIKKIPMDRSKEQDIEKVGVNF